MQEIHVASRDPFVRPGTIVLLVLLPELFRARRHLTVLGIQPVLGILGADGPAAIGFAVIGVRSCNNALRE